MFKIISTPRLAGADVTGDRFDFNRLHDLIVRIQYNQQPHVYTSLNILVSAIKHALQSSNARSERRYFDDVIPVYTVCELIPTWIAAIRTIRFLMSDTATSKNDLACINELEYHIEELMRDQFGLNLNEFTWAISDCKPMQHLLSCANNYYLGITLAQRRAQISCIINGLAQSQHQLVEEDILNAILASTTAPTGVRW